MPVTGPERYMQIGARIMFQRDPDGATVYPMIDLGLIRSITPSAEATLAELFDPQSGLNSKVAEAASQINESYDITTANFNLETLKFLYMANAVQTYSQTNTPVTGVVIPSAQIFPGELLPVVDANGDRVYNLASVEQVTGPSDTPVHVLGTDYEVADLERGLLRILAGGAIDGASDIEIDFTPNAIDGARQILPQTAPVVNGIAEIFFNSDNRGIVDVRRARASIAPAGANYVVEEFSDYSLTMSILGDITNTTNPAGTLTNIKGNVPSAS